MLIALACSKGTSLKSSQPDAAAGGAGGSGGSGGHAGDAAGGSSGAAGSFAGGTTGRGGSSATGGSATGGISTGAYGGSTTASGGSATGGASFTGSGDAAMGGQAGTSGPADDSLGQNPFARPAGSGILITSSDGLNSTELLLAADSEDGMFVAGATRNPHAMGLTAFDSGVVSEAFAARLDAQGKLVWTVPLKTCGVPADIAAGPGDSVFVLCPYEPTTTTLMPSTCDASALVTKLSGSDGRWSSRPASPGPPPRPTATCARTDWASMRRGAAT